MEPLGVKFTRPVWESGNGTTRGSVLLPILTRLPVKVFSYHHVANPDCAAEIVAA